MEKGQICYLINSYNIEPVEFIKECIGYTIHVKSLNNEEEHWVPSCYIYDTKEKAYKKLLSQLEDDKQEAEGTIENLEEELDLINEAIKNLKQKYEI